MSFFIVLTLCSQIAMECMADFIVPKDYATYQECIVNAYTEAQTRYMTINPLDAERHQLYIKFYCANETDLGLNAL